MDKSHKDMLFQLGKRIASIRKAKGLTQQELGEKAQLNYKHIGDIERGVQNPSLTLLQSIADGLDIEIVDFFQISGQADSRDEKIQSINKILESLPDQRVSQVLLALKILSLSD